VCVAAVEIGRKEPIVHVTAPDQYFLGYRRAEQERLQQQAMLLADEAAWLFDRVGLRPG
jgi:hypothetical protein